MRRVPACRTVFSSLLSSGFIWKSICPRGLVTPSAEMAVGHLTARQVLTVLRKAEQSHITSQLEPLILGNEPAASSVFVS